MDDRFYHSYLAPEVKVCGRNLQTFTLWHHLVLSSINSPVALGGPNISIPDLLLAVRVCGLKYGEQQIKPTIKDVFWRLKLTRNKKRFREEASKFYAWMSLQCSPPRFYRGGNTGGVTKGIESGPRCLGLACSLMYRGGVNEHDAWNSSLGKALWMDVQFAQLEGIQLRFLDDADLDDSEIDLSELTDEEAMEIFKADLPEEFVQGSFDHWKTNIKGKANSI